MRHRTDERTQWDKFFAKVDKNGPTCIHPVLGDIGRCWIWTASRRRNGKGHGYFMYDGAVGCAHRFAMILAGYEIPEGLSVLHHCDNPPCVNWDHLWFGTQAENIDDAVKKGRMPKGEMCSELSNDEVLEMRRLYDSGVPIKTIMILKNRKRGMVYHIVHRDRWKHLP